MKCMQMYYNIAALLFIFFPCTPNLLRAKSFRYKLRVPEVDAYSIVKTYNLNTRGQQISEKLNQIYNTK